VIGSRVYKKHEEFGKITFFTIEQKYREECQAGIRKPLTLFPKRRNTERDGVWNPLSLFKVTE
jgi:hypothetical protein